MDGFSASCEIGPAMILVSRWGAPLEHPSACIHFSLSLISLFIFLSPSISLSYPPLTPTTPCLSQSLSTILSTDTNTAVCIYCDCMSVCVCFPLYGASPT
ncbi:hypothetical protein ILYODFUR_010773 [Ilyodon furcidens]|uniref:Uncharacterized protein n=1 Tax=Ilyodon furcidens TaxID=33524 RepID=A0ABV0VFQ7_9TELE